MNAPRGKAGAFWGDEMRGLARTLLFVLLSILAALAVGAVFVVIVDVNPLEAFYYLLLKPFTSKLGIGEVMTKAIPLIIVGVGVAFASNGGCNNLGGEGQMYVGTIGMILFCTSPLGQAMGPLALPAGMLCAVLFGAIWGGFAGYMKAYYGSNELIVTLLLNYVALQLIAYLVNGPMMEYGGVNPQTAAIAKSMRLPKLFPGSRAHMGILIAIACVLAYWLIRKYTQFGYHLRVVGKSQKAAAYAGCNIRRYQFVSMIIAGGFSGLAASVEIAGVQYRLIEGVCEGMGISGMVVALIGMLNPVGIVLASVLLASLDTGAEMMQVACTVPVTLVDILQGVIVLLLLISFSFKAVQRKQKKRVTEKGGG